jgi:hypothetical protein
MDPEVSLNTKTIPVEQTADSVSWEYCDDFGFLTVSGESANEFFYQAKVEGKARRKRNAPVRK